MTSINYRFGLRWFFILLLGLLTTETGIFGQDTSTMATGSAKKPATSFFVAIGYPVSTTSPEFFQSYSSLFGGSTKEFKPAANFIAGAKIQLTSKFRFGLAFNYFRSTISESIQQRTDTSMFDPKYRSLNEDFSVNTMPIAVTAELTPVQSQFFTYFGAGLGMAASSVKWTEEVTPGSAFDNRKGGTHFDKTLISPLVRLYSGVELNFDDNPQKSFLGSLFVQADLTYMFRQAEIFRGISGQFGGISDKNGATIANGNYTILPVYICLNIGISFSFSS